MSKIPLNVTRPVLAYLTNIDSNFTVNSQVIAGFKKVLPGNHTVKGYVGVTDVKSRTLVGAFCWGRGAGLHSIEFTVTPRKGGTNVSISSVFPAGVSISTADQIKLAKIFLVSIQSKVHDRFVEKTIGPKKKGGGGPHPRLEARTRITGAGPQTYFNSAITNQTMTQTFADTANSLAVHYR